LWDDITIAPYKTLFNASTFGPNVWKLVQVLRTAEETMQEEARTLGGRERLIAVHGNRIVAWLVERDLDGKDPTKEEVKASTQKNLALVTEAVGALYSESYPASLFKNLSKCRQLVVHIEKKTGA
jgi:hypothetical protein